jgi:glycyl-tRNA synthetase beta chain
MPDFLLEIGLEEVPARMLASAQAELLKRTLALLTREQLISAEPTAHSYSTPRRLAVLVRDVLAQQPDITEETTGPAVKIAFKDGVPTPAAEAFARKSGVAVSELKTISTPKGDYLAATTLKRGRTAAEVLAAELPKEIAAIYWAKNMYWRPGKPERFVRPVLWLACLLGEEVVPVTFAGKTAGRATYGHRVLSTGEPFEIVTPDSYLAQLEGEYVLADVEVRRQKIRKALDKVTKTTGKDLRWREDEALVDAVTHLTEWPDVLLGSFEQAYLQLPEEVLVTVMRDHQKYFAVEQAMLAGFLSESPKLAPHFLAVTNIALDDINTPIIKQGNERVLRARFNDARFFWEFDQRVLLVDRVKLLENVTFQKDLGSYAKKTEQVRVLAFSLASIAASHGSRVDTSVINEAATIAKTDLTTELVKEFTELQGQIGGLYAAWQGINSAVADVIYDQYLPRNIEDSIPRSTEGALYAIADRLDTIASMFGIGLEPTGSKDPHGLRRAANGVIKILAETNLPISLESLLSMASLSSGGSFASADRVKKFIYERLEFYLRDVRAIPYDVVKAVLAVKPPDVVVSSADVIGALGAMGDAELTVGDIVSRAEDLSSMHGSGDFLAVCSDFKRIKNILNQAIENGEQIASEVLTGIFKDPAENNLESKTGLVKQRVNSLRAEKRYKTALEAIATLRPEIKAFFDSVQVRTSDIDVRANRLGLLAKVQEISAGIADFSEIVTAG